MAEPFMRFTSMSNILPTRFKLDTVTTVSLIARENAYEELGEWNQGVVANYVKRTGALCSVHINVLVNTPIFRTYIYF